MNQIDIHKKIDELVRTEPQSSDIKSVRDIIDINFDARMYFYNQVNEHWLDWLWKNGFLDVIKEKSDQVDQYSYKTPELDYLVRLTEKAPNKVVDIILQVPISKEHFNPEVVDRFLWIASLLPAAQLKKLMPKLRDDQWPKLMWRFNRWGFEYEKMLSKLKAAADYESLLTLADAMLTIRTQEELKKGGNNFRADNPFYLNDFSQTKIFEYLAKIDEQYLESALALISNVMNKVVLLGNRENHDPAFAVADEFYLFDVDFFDLKVGDGHHYSFRDDVKELAATLKELAQRSIESQCGNPARAEELYAKYIEVLPDSQSMWRLRLFIMSLCPEAFKAKLKSAFFRIFRNEDKPWGLINGAEYKRTLHLGFSALLEADRHDYVSHIFKYFGSRDGDDAQIWKREGCTILSSVTAYLTDHEKRKAEDTFGYPLDPNYEPEPAIKFGGMARSIGSKTPVTAEDLAKLSIAEIVDGLRAKWSPENLDKLNKQDDESFYNPFSADGISEPLQADMKNRFQTYVENAPLFFDRENLDPHYTYLFLRAIYDLLKNKNIQDKVDWAGLLTMLQNIVKSGEVESFEYGKRAKEFTHSWLAGWSGVHSMIAEVLQELLRGDDNSPIDFGKYRSELFAIIKYLFTHHDPGPEDETPDRGDLYSIAINSVRGKAFEALLFFVYHDGKKYSKDEQIKIATDVKEFYEQSLEKEKSKSMRFMFGHFLPSFFFRDEAWIMGLIPKLFPTDADKKDLYFASWEGYLSNNLYKEIFPKFETLYKRAINNDSVEYTDRKYFKDIDESLATHFALAYMFFPDFTLEHPLFKEFWSVKNSKRHNAFISFVGRHAISGDHKRVEEIGLDRLKDLWDWILTNVADSESFKEFGSWINPDQRVFEINWLAEHIRKSLEKTSGEIVWEYGLIRALPDLTEKTPRDAMAILTLYLSNIEKFGIQHHASMYIDSEIFEVLNILYAKEETKQQVYDLINKLLLQGNSRFWKLKEVLGDT